MFKSPGSTNAEPPGQGSGAPGVPPDHGDESEGGTGGGKEDDSELHPPSPELQADPTQQPPPSIQDSQSSVGSTNRDGSNGAGSSAGGRGSSGSTDQEVPKKEEEDSGPVSQESSHENDVLKPLPEPNPVPLPGVAKPERGLDNGHAGEHTAAENTNSKLPTAEGSNLESPQGAGGLGESQQAEEAKGLAQSPDGSLPGAPHARLRRLSEPKETPAHYLTVIVHFDGRSVSRGMAALSSVFFVGATVLLSAF
ncbi:Toxoplasma gondii family A protein [Besnoitia besnoiti]|uniref:Toxoplasma gondii family A protein n=1 Tax=Besnoitia besnoiti TaxID=94643 RepID=A0A2A9MME9_BESBE|nr:Toxoplasma gondii family A protein [Besnoitia besnoiti]PFH36740.1 Toxoplasma gondii family A protein [Besnoitia besnoiti]